MAATTKNKSNEVHPSRIYDARYSTHQRKKYSGLELVGRAFKSVKVYAVQKGGRYAG